MFRTVFPSIIRSARLYIQQYLFDKCLLLYVYSRTPDDGRKGRPKHVECHSKINEFDTLAHLVSVTIGIILRCTALWTPKHTFLFNYSSFSGTRTFYERMWQNVVESDSSRAADALSILQSEGCPPTFRIGILTASSRQQWLRERASMLHYSTRWARSHRTHTHTHTHTLSLSLSFTHTHTHIVTRWQRGNSAEDNAYVGAEARPFSCALGMTHCLVCDVTSPTMYIGW